MRQALPSALRQEIVSLGQSGKTYRQIREQLHVGYATSKNIWYTYQKQAEAGLQPRYANCGSRTKRSAANMYRLVLWLKRLHPSWGAGHMRIGLLSRYDEKLIPSERTMQRWFKEKKLTKPPQQGAQSQIGPSKAVHTSWQVDAKENITTLDGKAACYLTLSDEKSGGWLSSMAFAYGRIRQVPIGEVRAKLIEFFSGWGKPGAMRVDNGSR